MAIDGKCQGGNVCSLKVHLTHLFFDELWKSFQVVGAILVINQSSVNIINSKYSEMLKDIIIFTWSIYLYSADTLYIIYNRGYSM